jgi:hypothetical protein
MEWLFAITAAAALWVFLGSAGSIYWWTSSFDLEAGDAIAMVALGVAFGPFTWILGRYIHGKPGERVIMKKRSSPESERVTTI